MAADPSLYLACQTNDLIQAKLCVKRMTRKEIDYQYSLNNETALHVATRNQNKELIQLLLSHGAQRSLRNTDDQQAYDLARTKEIQDLFKRPKSSRFAYHPDETSYLPQNKSSFGNCSLFNDDAFYEWELVDRNASQKALRFRRELRSSTSMNEKELKQKLYSILKGYINLRLEDINGSDSERIYDYFDRALRELKPSYMVTAYTISQKFSKLFNRDMARNVMHNFKNGCSIFSCDCLYSTEDGTKSITNILLRHPEFQQLSCKGKVYRGIVMPKNTLDHYDVGSCIITTTLLSASKNEEVARFYCENEMSNPTEHSFFCIYEVLNDNHTAIDISTISEYKTEDEVLILPYSAFLITKIEQEQQTTNIYLKEQSLTDIFDDDRPLKGALKSAVDLLYLIGKSIGKRIES